MKQETAVILLVSKQTSMRKVIQSHLFRRGFVNILEASDGREAQTHLQQNPINCIICDWEMPDIEGIDLLLQVRSDPELQSTLFMLVTAETDRNNIDKAILAGVDDLLIQPFTPAKLCEKVLRLTQKSTHIPREITIDMTDPAESDPSYPLLQSLLDEEISLDQDLPEQEVSEENTNASSQLIAENTYLKAELDRLSDIDLKAPLTELLSLSQDLLQHRSLSAEVKQQLKQMDHLSHNLLAQVDGSLNLWKMETGQYELRPESFDLIAITEQVINAERPHAKDRSVTIALDAPNKCRCYGEALLCRTLLGNLVRLAVDASPKKETVLLTIHTDEHLHITVHHMGLTSIEQQNQFFNKYPSSNNSAVSDAYAARIISIIQGGDITVVSKVNEGTLLMLRLPKGA